MWTKEILGTDVLHLVQCFILYSMLGWLVESVYMSLCNRKLTNRGFASSPICPIYGFGGVLGYLILHPLSRNLFMLYILGALLATAFEFLVAKLMDKVLGTVWWDYSDKPLNYKGMICAESTVAWGFYAVIIVNFLHKALMRTVDSIPTQIGIVACRVIMVCYGVDFAYHLYRALDINLKEYQEKVRDSYHNFRAKWQ
ncbi:MAG: putative ABC transporter permease [Roseburia sp.]|nr:putative ABC transporter permease [Roseburia sp.]MCM1277526.1 putative ABC transporter permease [Robinsoniella sp.]